jgi:hypothetical protein
VRRGAIATLLVGWLGAFLVVKGFSPRASIEANTFWRLLMPAWPAYLLLVASIPLLVPTLARRLGDRVRPPEARAVSRRWVIVAAVVTLVVPAVATAASDQVQPPTPALTQTTATATTILTPVDDEIDLQVEREGTGQRLRWTAAPWRASVFYRVFRSDGDDDLECVTRENTAWLCVLRGAPIATTRATEFVDMSPPEAGATYRIGVGTNWVNDPAEGDLFAFSPPEPSVP